MTNAPNVGLFATCLVDLYRPSVGFAAADLLEDSCGNHRDLARQLAHQIREARIACVCMRVCARARIRTCV